MGRMEVRRAYLVAIAATVLALLVAQIALTGSAATTGGPQATASAGVGKKLKKLTQQLKQLQQQVDELSLQPGPPGQAGSTGAQGPAGQDATVPTGAVTFFNLAACPSGWTELTTARGRYLVGLPPGGTLGGTAGNRLVNLEDRPVGQHSHGVTDPGHTHTTLLGSGTVDDATGGSADRATNTGVNFALVSNPASTGISVDNTGPTGTNAPYIQLLVCQKN